MHNRQLRSRLRSGLKAIRKALDGAATIRDLYRRIANVNHPADWHPLFVICESCGRIGTTIVTGFALGWNGVVYWILVGPLAMVFWRTFENGYDAAWSALTTPETLQAFEMGPRVAAHANFCDARLREIDAQHADPLLRLGDGAGPTEVVAAEADARHDES
mgnify:CR=1 FL=1